MQLRQIEYLPVFDVIHVDGPNLQLLLNLLDALHLDLDHPDHVLHRGLTPSVAQLAPQLPHLGVGIMTKCLHR